MSGECRPCATAFDLLPSVNGLDQHFVQCKTADFFVLLVLYFLESQRFVVDVASAPGETTHLPLLFAVGPQREFERLPAFHGYIIFWSMKKYEDLRHGRHCVSAMHVHLVFVSKYRGCRLDGEATEALRPIFSKV
jgi:hypothetical protein